MTRVKCYNCQRKGHFARDCPKIRKGHKGKYRASIAAEDESQKMKTKWASSNQETRREYYLISILSGSLSNNAESWWVDSGASRHMIGNKGVLVNFKEKKFSAQVELGDNASYAIEGIGSTSFQLESGGELHIEEILYVPSLKKNLISVAVLEDKSYRVIYMDKKALLWPKNEELSSTIVIGVREGGLYKLLGHIQALVHASVSPSELWHWRFGHLHYKALPELQKMVNRVQNEGYYGGVRLLIATCKMFLKYCHDHKITLHGQNFTLSYDTNIPRQAGLSGSSAIVCASLNCLLDFYDVRHLVKVEHRPNLILSAEGELGITAGLQDRVAQVYGGLVYMDFKKEYMDKMGHGEYIPMDTGLLPQMHLIYAENPSDSGKIHSAVRQRWLDGDELIRSSMEEVAGLAIAGRESLIKKDYSTLAKLMDRNFDLRRLMFGDDALGSLNIKMVEVARSVGAAAKFTGSGGAVIAFCPNGAPQVRRLEDACRKAGFIIQPVILVPPLITKDDLQTSVGINN